MPRAFLSKPAARPRTLGKVSPIAATGGPGVRRREVTGLAARTARKPSRCAFSASSRVKPWSKRNEYAPREEVVPEDREERAPSRASRRARTSATVAEPVLQGPHPDRPAL